MSCHPRMHCGSATALALLLATVGLAQSPAAWNQFRGPDGTGSAAAPNLPVKFSDTENVRWAKPIHDKGWSSPVVFGDQVWVTTGRADGRELFAVCVDLQSGEVVHDVKVFDVPRPQSENAKLNTHATPTPVIELGRIYVHFGVYGTACLDTKTGEKLWERRDLKCDHRVRAASSPILDGDLLFLTFDGVDNRFIVALDKKTGETRWRRDREGQTDAVEFFRKQGFADPEGIAKKKPNDNLKSYATPTVLEHDGRRQLISPAAEWTLAFDPRTGESLWRMRHRGMAYNRACRPVYGNGLVYFTTGIAKQLLAVRPSGNGDVTKTHVAWSGRRAIPNYSSPLLVGDLLFYVSDQGGVVSCVDAKTGERVWRKRLGDGGSHWASPVHASGRIYFCSAEGTISVLAAGREFEKLADNRIDGEIMATPAIAGEALLIRSKTHLYCFVEGGTGKVTRPASRRPRGRRLSDSAVESLLEYAARLDTMVERGELTKAEAEAKFRAALAKTRKR